MSKTLNKVMLIGNVGNKPEITLLSENKKVANFSLATNEAWRDKTTDIQHKKTVWHRVVVFNQRLIESVEKYIDKGELLFIEGKINNRKKIDSEGFERDISEIVIESSNGGFSVLDRSKYKEHGRESGEITGDNLENN